MKKTLIITLEYPPHIGGIATYVHDMASAFDREKTVVYAPQMGDTKQWDASVGYNVIRQTPYFPPFIWPRWMRLFFQIKKIVKQEKIEVILINHVIPVGYVGLLIKKFFNIPYLIISHGTDVVMGTRNAWKKKLMTRVVQHSEQIVFNSESLKRRFLEILPEFSDKSLVLYPCPNKDFLIPPPDEDIDAIRSSLALQGKKVMLSVSRLDEGKGFPHLVRALPQILEKEPHLVWLIIGDGPKKADVLKLIQERHLQNVVRFIGEIPHDDVKKYYYLADLFVLLTHPDNGREEGLGLVFLEAAAAGLPIVAGRSGGVDEAVLNTETGLIIDIQSQARSIDDAIITLLSNKNFADRLGMNGKQRIESSFRWEHQIERLGKWIM